MLPAMSSSSDFNVTAAGALVLGGIAALLFATVIALGGYGRPRGHATAVSASAAAPSLLPAGGALAEGEYLLDTSEPAPTPAGPTP